MFRRIVDFKPFNLRKIIEYLKSFIFSQKCFYIRWKAFLQDKPNFLKLKMMKI